MAVSLDVDESYLAFERRALANKALPRVDNSRLPLGSPMHYLCVGCYADMERDEGDFGPKKERCKDCELLHEAGLLVGFIERLNTKTA